MFKYTSITGAQRTVKDKTLKFTNPADFNDPFEFYNELVKFDISQKHMKQIIKKRIKNKDRIRNKIERFKANKPVFINHLIEQFENRKKSTKVSCFSLTNKNILMWSHYSSFHTGACIEFSTDILKETFSQDCLIESVIYKRKLKALNFSKYKEKAINHWILTKSKDWKYEKEKRIILGNNPDELQRIPAEAILKLTFGCKTEKKDIQNMIKLIETNNLDWIKISKMEMSKRKYELIESYLR